MHYREVYAYIDWFKTLPEHKQYIVREFVRIMLANGTPLDKALRAAKQVFGG